MYDVEGWESLSEDQKNVFHLVFQDHAKTDDMVSLDNVVKVAPDPDFEMQVCVYYKNESHFYYGLEPDGSSMWY